MSTTTKEHTPFAVTVTGSWGRSEVPPRCRKPRLVTHEESVQVTIPRVTSDTAPVAFHVAPEGDYRLYEGHLYFPHRPWARQHEPTIPGTDHFPETQGIPRWWANSAEEFDRAARDWAQGFVIIDGEVWIRCGEPRYVVMTFGLGHNHGGTGLMVDTTDNSNIKASSYFRADEFEAAHEYAVRVASNRGDSDSISRFKQGIEVLIPEAVTLVTVQPETTEQERARHEYHDAVRRLNNLLSEYPTPEQEGAAFAALALAREQVLTLGVSTIEPEQRPYEARSA